MNKSSLPIKSPCHVDFASMTPADRGRFCADCKKVVHELAQLTEREARELLSTPRNGELCVRYVYDEHGRIFFADSPRNLVSPTLLVRAKRAAMAAAALAAPLTLAACGIGGTMQGGFEGGGYVDNRVIAEGPDADASADADAAADAAGDASGDAHADGGADAGEEDDASDAAPDSYVPPQ